MAPSGRTAAISDVPGLAKQTSDPARHEGVEEGVGAVHVSAVVRTPTEVFGEETSVCSTTQ